MRLKSFHIGCLWTFSHILTCYFHYFYEWNDKLYLSTRNSFVVFLTHLILFICFWWTLQEIGNRLHLNLKLEFLFVILILLLLLFLFYAKENINVKAIWWNMRKRLFFFCFCDTKNKSKQIKSFGIRFVVIDGIWNLFHRDEWTLRMRLTFGTAWS